MATKAHPTPRPPRHFPEDEGLSPDLVARRRDARRAGHRAAQAAYRTAYRHELALAGARTPLRDLPGTRPPGALGALAEAYHRRYDVAHPGTCSGSCRSAALRLLAFLPDPWRITDDPDAPARDAYTWTKHALDADVVALLPAPWRLVANRSLPRYELDEEAVNRLARTGMWGSRLPDFEARGAPGEPADSEAEHEQAKAAVRAAAAAGRQPDLTGEGPSMSVRRFILRLWAQARREHYRPDDPFMDELHRQLTELRANPYGGRRR